MKCTFVWVILFCIHSRVFAKINEIRIVTEDVYHFWEAIDNMKPGCDTTSVFQQMVIDRATDEFKIFIKNWNIKATDYTKQFKQFPGFYASLKPNTLRLTQMQDSIYTLINKFRQIYPGFNPADVCVALGNFSTGGTVAIKNGRAYVYIGLEFHAPDTTTFLSELPTTIKGYLSRSNFLRTIIHEFVHVQQQTHGQKVKRSYYGNQLINHILREGIPDFIGALIYPYGESGDHVVYGMKNEKSLKQKLAAEIHGKDDGKWFAMNSKLSGMPNDVGYFMGARIALYYFNKNMNTHKDVTDIIDIKDVSSFVEKSGYFL